MQEPAHLYAKIMWNIALCPCGFEATTERPIQAASAVGRFMPGVEDARDGNVLERASLVSRGTFCMQSRVAGCGRGLAKYQPRCADKQHATTGCNGPRQSGLSETGRTQWIR